MLIFFYLLYILMFSRLLRNWYVESLQSLFNSVWLFGVVLYFLYLILCIYLVIKLNKKNSRKLLKSSKSSLFSQLWNYIKYPTIWFVIWFTSWAQVYFIYELLYEWLNWYDLNYDSFSDEFVLFSSVSSFFSVVLVIIASYFIWLSFGNKFVRAIGDLFYLIWLLLPVVTFFIICWYQ